tara:strand:- start:165 stop:431 length:267 start_codon:yes stop_codon:yes gene_type:complete
MKLTKSQLKQIIKEELETLSEHEDEYEYDWQGELAQAMHILHEIYVSIENEAQLDLFMKELPMRVDEMIKAWEEERGPAEYSAWQYHR